MTARDRLLRLDLLGYLDGPTLEELIRVADGLMYSVKRSGKNQIRHGILGMAGSRDKELSA